MAPKILALETSSRTGSVALALGPALLAEITLPPSSRHANALMPAIAELTARQGWKPADLDHLYLSIGPGSFTGLRIAVALARALAHAIPHLQLVAVPSLDVIAHNVPPEFPTVVPMLDAKRGQIFTALYTRQPGAAADPDLIRITAQHLTTPAAILAQALTHSTPIALLGEGLDYHRGALPAADPRFTELPKTLWIPRAATVHTLGLARAQQNLFTPARTLLPTYIRLPEAEEVYRKKHDLPL